MSSAAEPAPVPARSAWSSTTMVLAVGGFLLQVLAMIPGYHENDKFQTAEYLVMVAIAAAVTIIVFAFPVRRAGVRWALGLAVLGLVTDIVFWSGVPVPLAAGGAALALISRERGDNPRMANAALIVAALAVVGFIAIVIGDASSS